MNNSPIKTKMKQGPEMNEWMEMQVCVKCTGAQHLNGDTQQTTFNDSPLLLFGLFVQKAPSIEPYALHLKDIDKKLKASLLN